MVHNPLKIQAWSWILPLHRERLKLEFRERDSKAMVWFPAISNLYVRKRGKGEIIPTNHFMTPGMAESLIVMYTCTSSMVSQMIDMFHQLQLNLNTMNLLSNHAYNESTKLFIAKNLKQKDY